jgi:hypothetical protein
MEPLGDLERFAATTLYPLRLPLAALAVAVAVIVAVVAVRRGWLAAARRHPGRTAVALLVAALVIAPTTWYLGSPLLVRTELDEPPPAAIAGAPDPTNPAAPDPSAGPSDSPAETSEPLPPGTPAGAPAGTSEPTPPATPIVRSGTFVGADDFHFGRGTATLTQAADGSHTLRFEDFSVRNGPDLFVYLSPDPAGYADGAIELGRLRATDGNFNTPIPAGIDVGSAGSVVIWCKQFAVLFAVAALDG